MWRDVQRTQLGNMVGAVIGLVLAHGDATAALGLGLEHVFRRARLGCSHGIRHLTPFARIKLAEGSAQLLKNVTHKLPDLAQRVVFRTGLLSAHHQSRARGSH